MKIPGPLVHATACLTFVAFATACGPAVEGSDAGPLSDGGVADAGYDAGPPPDSWGNYAGEFLTTYCVACHSGGARDYRTIADVQRDVARIRCGVSAVALDGCGGSSPSPSQFPIGAGPFPTDDQRARLVQWLDDGLLE